ncbi:dihydroorotate dehydrogenase (quinone) [Natronomonas pharaonis DSM 2160]|uniref:Dihydroorotate dehydrogenase (quinone) n=1 Tax=Natronomonas pharaonis (strain ATCC 35678 / DSM 2160 / CIP 103997 / JCM 8858 / NBRC 14720 / NCIMB 2260 / Gabara) TaxID=348780 RepID=PYRD_NATPD|nr:quinone-dependent dihydroorotate dehydrogenase [Natronomonas pharaonis]Q3IU78.1 RecName: Full=Dihydroorotate dehydrogenase (quinone); AltName: Full=DHOdehase; Short=DHOD; Short=DHODase; AltName: Full=Dihydroorotate oxidase [Natronomonas pharaonis DSM 2160]CAI48305.1 dihydroorotate dehydrogenase (quinone) [Natronomonas pharaonis DSM 2160]
MGLYQLLKPALFQLDAETAHGLGHRVLDGIQGTPLERIVADYCTVVDPRLRVDAFGQTFPNPVGVAAGFDKNAEIPDALGALGFGHVEVGGVTAEPQAGNPRPRMFRLAEDRALINRMGFNNDGADIVGERLAATDCRVPVGVNIGKSKSAANDDAEADYQYTYERVADGGDYFVVNVSSPNTPGLRELQSRDRLESILGTLQDDGASPLLVKLSPDLTDAAIEDAIEVVEDLGLDGIIATNTTTKRPASLHSDAADEEGGLSGAPITDESTDIVRFIAKRTDKPIVGVGGIDDAESAYEKIRNGASVVQLYTGLVYEGPTIARDINRGLLKLLERDGFASVEDAVGVDI